MNAATPQLPITLPLKIRRSSESFAIEDAAGRSVSYIYFESEESRRRQTRRFTEDEARKIAQTIARLLTEVEGENAGPNPSFIALEDLNAENDE